MLTPEGVAAESCLAGYSLQYRSRSFRFIGIPMSAGPPCSSQSFLNWDLIEDSEGGNRRLDVEG